MSIPTEKDLLPRSPRHSPQDSRRAHQRTHQLVRPGLRSSMMRLMKVGVVLLARRSKSCQKVVKKLKDH